MERILLFVPETACFLASLASEQFGVLGLTEFQRVSAECTLDIVCMSVCMYVSSVGVDINPRSVGQCCLHAFCLSSRLALLHCCPITQNHSINQFTPIHFFFGGRIQNQKTTREKEEKQKRFCVLLNRSHLTPHTSRHFQLRQLGGLDSVFTRRYY
mgnify:CR=1 FL=1